MDDRDPRPDVCDVTSSRQALPGLTVAAASAVAVAGVVRAVVVISGGWLFYSAATGADAPGPSWAVSLVALLTASVVATVLCVVWLHRARIAAEHLPGPAPRWARGWSIASWFIPLVGAVLTPLVLADVWRSSAAHPRRPLVVWVWATALVSGWVLFTVVAVSNALRSYQGTTAALGTAVIWTLDGVIELVGSIALAAAVVQIGRAQVRAGIPAPTSPEPTRASVPVVARPPVAPPAAPPEGPIDPERPRTSGTPSPWWRRPGPVTAAAAVAVLLLGASVTLSLRAGTGDPPDAPPDPPPRSTTASPVRTVPVQFTSSVQVCGTALVDTSSRPARAVDLRSGTAIPLPVGATGPSVASVACGTDAIYLFGPFGVGEAGGSAGLSDDMVVQTSGRSTSAVSLGGSRHVAAAAADPDGSSAYLVVTEDATGTGPAEIDAVDPSGSRPRAVARVTSIGLQPRLLVPPAGDRVHLVDGSRLRTIDTRTGTVRDTGIPGGAPSSPDQLTVSRDGRTVFVVTRDGLAAVDTENSGVRFLTSASHPGQRVVSSVAASPDGRSLVELGYSGSYGLAVVVVDIATGRETEEVRFGKSPATGDPRAVALSPDGSQAYATVGTLGMAGEIVVVPLPTS